MRISIATGSSGILDKYVNNRQKEIVSKYITGKIPGYVLDAGMGAGRWTDFLCNRSRQEIGVDVSREMINVARENIKNENARFIICSNTYLPFKDNTFDLSFCCFSLLYLILMIDFNKAVEELIRVTKKNRRIIVIDITSRRPALSDLMLRRTSSQYTKAFSIHGAILEHIHGYYTDYPIRIYQFILRKILKLFYRSPQGFDKNIWVWSEKRGQYFNMLLEIPLIFIIIIMYPIDKLLAKNFFQPICPEKVFFFMKKDLN